MSYPYMNPESIIYSPSNAQVNESMKPIFCPTQKVTITGVSLTSGTAVNVADAASEIWFNLVQLANATNVVATGYCNATSNLIANTPFQLTLNSQNKVVSAGTVIGLNVKIENVANTSFGTAATWQIDYVQGSPGSEG